MKWFVLALALAACAHEKGDSTVPGPQLGDSTARGPANSAAPIVDAAVASELSAPIRPRTGAPDPTPTPANQQPQPPPAPQPGVFSPPPDGGTR